MLIKDIVIAALSLAGRRDAAEALSSGEYEGERELEHAISAMLHCVNATEDELARAFFPLEREEEFKATGGRIYYTVFAKTPVKILSVTQGGRPVKHEISPEYLAAEGTVRVRYAYCPAKKVALRPKRLRRLSRGRKNDRLRRRLGILPYRGRL